MRSRNQRLTSPDILKKRISDPDQRLAGHHVTTHLVNTSGATTLPHLGTPKLTTPTISQMSCCTSASVARGPPLSPRQVEWPAWGTQYTDSD